MSAIHDSHRLKELQELPLERKIGITAARIGAEAIILFIIGIVAYLVKEKGAE